MPLPSALDDQLQYMARVHIRAHAAGRPLYGRVLEIGPSGDIIPQRSCAWDTLDIDPARKATYTADITRKTKIEDSTYDAVLCLEVLEHTTNPFSALAEIRRILKPGGAILASAPMNFREHGPIPDCWRFTRHGWRVLLKDWDAVQLDVLMTPDRPLMPLHINATALCNKEKKVRAEDMTFKREES